ncbi:MAG: glycosyltransferase family 39 protein [Verrucomicrobia bacterium]|nr:glycosyltransferase family 39 protein [Verrucomicrobiota bacterium]
MHFKHRLFCYGLFFAIGTAILCGLGLDSDLAQAYCRENSRWIFLAVFAIAGVSAWDLYKFLQPAYTWNLRAAAARWPVILFVGFCTAFSLSREPFNYKVTADEYVLGVEAMAIHYEGRSDIAVSGYELGGVYRMLGGVVNKRPPVFVSLLSLVHDITGYRPQNVFYLNALIVGVFYIFLFVTANRFYGLNAAYFACSLFAAFPLFYQNASGGGFELLNLLLVLMFIWSSSIYIDKPEKTTQRFLILVAIILANTRYESAVFAGAAGIIILLGWIKRRSVIYDVSLYLAPLVMMTFLFRLSTFQDNFEGNWQIRAGMSPFSLEYFYDNLGHALNYFFAFSRGSTSFELIFILGLPCMIFMLYGKLKSMVREGISSCSVSVWVASVVVVFNFGVLLFYHWGQVDASEVSRLILPFALICVLSTCYLLFDQVKHILVSRILWGLLFICLFTISIPRAATANSSLSNYNVRRADWTIKVLNSLPPTSYVVASPDGLRLFLDKIQGVPIGLLNERARQLAFHYKLKTFTALVVQQFFVDPDTQKETVFPGDWLHPAYKTSIIAETTVRPYVITRFSRVDSVDEKLMEIPTKDLAPKNTMRDKGGDIKPISGDSVDKWMQNLP